MALVAVTGAGAGLGKSERDRAADPGARAGHRRHFACERERIGCRHVRSIIAVPKLSCAGSDPRIHQK